MKKQTADDIDLHGLRIDEAINKVNVFLEAAFRLKKTRVWVIHGKGTGTLRRAVRHHLMKHHLVRSCRTAGGSRGGDGATEVDLSSALARCPDGFKQTNMS